MFVLLYLLVSNQSVNIHNLCSLENSIKGVWDFNYPFTDTFDNASKKLGFAYPKTTWVFNAFSYFYLKYYFLQVIIPL